LRAKTALYEAAANGHVNVVRALLDRGGANVHKSKFNDWSPLMVAASHGHVAVVEALAGRYSPADLDESNREGNTALHLACRNAHVDVVRLLLAAGANPEAENHNRRRPLHAACHSGNAAIVGILLDRGCDAEARDKSGGSVYHEAAEGGSVDVLALLLTRCVNAKSFAQSAVDCAGHSPLHAAAAAHHAAMCRALVRSCGLDVNARNHAGQPPLITASLKGAPDDVVNALLDAGASWTAADVALARQWGKTRAASLMARREPAPGSIPRLFLGTYKLMGDDAVRGVASALRAGYRALDCAEFYGNQQAIGAALKGCAVDRSALFVCSKVWNASLGRVEASVRDSLAALGLDYLDLALVHWPVRDRHVHAYADLVALQRRGLVRLVGVSNYKVADLEALERAGLPAPAVNQIELSPLLYHRELVDYMRAHGIVPMAYRTLFKGSGDKLAHPVLAVVARKHGRTAGQVSNRWAIQACGAIVLPKSADAGRQEENAGAFDFALDADDVYALSALTKPEDLAAWWESEGGTYAKGVGWDTAAAL